MKRDLDLQRQILFKIEAYDGVSPPYFADLSTLHTDADVIGYNAVLLKEAGFIVAADMRTKDEPFAVMAQRLTHNGHDFLDSVRDDKIWKMAKDGALAGSGFTLNLLGDLAKGFVRKTIAKATDVEL